jgi:hypothetical protein
MFLKLQIILNDFNKKVKMIFLHLSNERGNLPSVILSDSNSKSLLMQQYLKTHGACNSLIALVPIIGFLLILNCQNCQVCWN